MQEQIRPLTKTQEAAKRGLILVDTKYELGKDSAGNILVVDEIHTPDSSRYWVQVCLCERRRLIDVREVNYMTNT